jgi:hypothetical protein
MSQVQGFNNVTSGFPVIFFHKAVAAIWVSKGTKVAEDFCITIPTYGVSFWVNSSNSCICLCMLLQLCNRDINRQGKSLAKLFEILSRSLVLKFIPID